MQIGDARDGGEPVGEFSKRCALYLRRGQRLAAEWIGKIARSGSVSHDGRPPIVVERSPCGR
jgi:hypothetical protein